MYEWHFSWFSMASGEPLVPRGIFLLEFTKLSYPSLTTINLRSDFKTCFQNNKMLAWTSHIKLGPLVDKQLLVLSDILWGSMKATDLSNLRIK